jgi:HSP20 family protein
MTREATNPVPVPVKHERKSVVRQWNPFEEMDRMFESLLPRGWLLPFKWERPLLAELGLHVEGRLPKVDLIDRDTEILVRAEVPGVAKDDLEVVLTGDAVTIKGEIKHEEKEEKGEYYRSEMTHGAFSRTLGLPVKVDAENATAEFKDGVLEIKLPKVEQAKRRTLKIA